MGMNVKNYADLKWVIEHLPGFQTNMELKTNLTLGLNVSLDTQNRILITHTNCNDEYA